MKIKLILIVFTFFLTGCATKPWYEDYEPITKDMPAPAKIAEAAVFLPAAIVTAAGQAFYNMAEGLSIFAGSAVQQTVAGVAGGNSAMPFHGNWCGPGVPKEGENPEPVDKLDAACKTHDLCYASKGYYNCECDEQILENIYAIHGSNRADFSLKERAIIRYFGNSPCNGCKEVNVEGYYHRVGKCQ